MFEEDTKPFGASGWRCVTVFIRGIYQDDYLAFMEREVA